MNPPKKRKRTATSRSGLKEPRPKPVECPVCFVGRPPSLIHTISACNCTYCTYCIREVFSVAAQADNGVYWRPAMCCDQKLDYDLFEPCLTPQIRRSYKSRAEEKEVNQPLYCGNLKCREYILRTNVKDGFGSCGRCKMKSCAKPECTKTMAEHLGTHAICPGELETKELRELADQKGWKRCPKCFALTERSRGCNDIRCICRTEWCYTCGKVVKGTKNACQCHPLPARPTPHPAPDEIELQREVVIVHDGGNARAFGSLDVDMVDVKPSIEDIEAQPRPPLYTDAELLAELNRRAGMPGPSSSRVEADVMAELDSLAVPNRRGNGDLSRRPAAQANGDANDGVPDFCQRSSLENAHDTLEDMLQAFHGYEAPPPHPTSTSSVIDLENVEQLSENRVQHEPARNSPDAQPVPSFEAPIAPAEHGNVPDKHQTEPPQSSHSPLTEDTTATDMMDVASDRPVPAEVPTTTLPDSTSSANTERFTHDSTSDVNTPESRLPAPQAATAQEALVPENNSDCLMDAIEEYLVVHGGYIKLERTNGTGDA